MQTHASLPIIVNCSFQYMSTVSSRMLLLKTKLKPVDINITFNILKQYTLQYF